MWSDTQQGKLKTKRKKSTGLEEMIQIQRRMREAHSIARGPGSGKTTGRYETRKIPFHRHQLTFACIVVPRGEAVGKEVESIVVQAAEKGNMTDHSGIVFHPGFGVPHG